MTKQAKNLFMQLRIQKCLAKSLEPQNTKGETNRFYFKNTLGKMVEKMFLKV